MTQAVRAFRALLHDLQIYRDTLGLRLLVGVQRDAAFETDIRDLPSPVLRSPYPNRLLASVAEHLRDFEMSTTLAKHASARSVSAQDH